MVLTALVHEERGAQGWRAVLGPFLQPHHKELSTVIWAGCATGTLGMVLG